jgi:cyclopropane fatty-acyl-phospholipid synthase-like methyltransferase
MGDKPFAPAAERNSAAILELLRYEFRDCGTVLEIGSGTGQHAVHFAAALGHLHWQTSDVDDNHAAINAWIDDSGISNVASPLCFDVRTDEIGDVAYDGVFSANTAHIMSFDAVEQMIAKVSRALRANGVFCLYGPFRIGGKFSTASNERFHASLQAGNPEMGIRDLDDMEALLNRQGLQRAGLHAMPANNLALTWRKGGVPA